MVNVQKIKNLAKKQGISLAFICSELGLGRNYLHDAAYGKTTISDDRLMRIAEILHTTPEYLKDETDVTKEKTAPGKPDAAPDPQEQELMTLLSRLSPVQKQSLVPLLRSMLGEDK